MRLYAARDHERHTLIDCVAADRPGKPRRRRPDGYTVLLPNPQHEHAAGGVRERTHGARNDNLELLLGTESAAIVWHRPRIGLVFERARLRPGLRNRALHIGGV